MDKKVTRFFSKPLMKQNIKGNYILAIAIIVIMCLITTVSTFASSKMPSKNSDIDYTESTKTFYSYLYIMKSYNELTKASLSYEDYEKTEDKSTYEQAFSMISQQSNEEYSTGQLDSAIHELKTSEIDMNTYVRQFEYVYALNGVKGCFTGTDLSVDDMMQTMLTGMGIDAEMIENMAEMDSTALFNKMSYAVIGLLPLLIFIVIVGNALIVNQVDKGSMAYVLSTPTKRFAVANTQAIFGIVAPLIIVACTCVTRIIASFAFLTDVNVMGIIALYIGMYLLAEAIFGICYLGSCIFNRSKQAMAFGGGITVWCFIASLLGMFGSADMVSMGFGASQLDIFNKLTLVGLFDIQSLSTIGTDSINYDFVPKLVVLVVISVICYAVGIKKFEKKDLPL